MNNFNFYKKEIEKLSLALIKISKMDPSMGKEMSKIADEAIKDSSEYPEEKYMSGWGKGKDE